MINVHLRQSHSQNHFDPWNLTEAPKGLHLTLPPAINPTNFVVGGLVTVRGNRDDQFLRTSLHDLARVFDDLVREVAIGRIVEQQEIRALVDHSVRDLDKILAQRDLPARKIHPEEVS